MTLRVMQEEELLKVSGGHPDHNDNDVIDGNDSDGDGDHDLDDHIQDAIDELEDDEPEDPYNPGEEEEEWEE